MLASPRTYQIIAKPSEMGGYNDGTLAGGMRHIIAKPSEMGGYNSYGIEYGKIIIIAKPSVALTTRIGKINEKHK